jgi:hypothetical protein
MLVEGGLVDSALRLGAFGAAVLLALAASAPHATAAKPITGKLSEPGYTVIALTANGKARSVVAKRRAFRLTPRAERATLHLRAPNGIYAGPVVIRGQGRRAILGVKAGARLGKIRVRPSYARVTRPLARKWVDRTRVARARRGVPIGAGVFGRVRSTLPRAKVPGDPDRDGIPDPLDIDDDGDLILDDLDRSSGARASQTEEGFGVNSYLASTLIGAVNANAASLTAEQVDAALAGGGVLKIGFVPGDSAELDCGSPQSRTDPTVGGLVYCSRGGTGSVQQPELQISDFPPFPDCCDPDGDGFGTFQPLAKHPTVMTLRHGATSAQIGTGDLLIERVTTGGVETQFPATLQYVFATTPALVSYDDGRGNSATISYPFMPTQQQGIALPVAAGPNGDVVVTVTFWRPQRRPIPPETGEWIDIGRLIYTVGVSGTDLSCPKRAFSESDPNLSRGGFITPNREDVGVLTDAVSDGPASPANTFTYTLNLTQCLAAIGISFNPGETRDFHFDGNALGGSAGQNLSFKRQ